MYDEIADAAEDRAPYLAEPARPHHDVAGLLARRHVEDELAGLLEVRHELAPQLRVPRNAHNQYTLLTRQLQLFLMIQVFNH